MSTAAEIIAAAIEEHTSSMSYSFPEDDALVILDALSKHDYTLVRMGRADHVHLARQADGTITAVPMKFAPMRSCGAHPHRDCDEDPRNDCKWLTKWVDVDEVSS